MTRIQVKALDTLNDDGAPMLYGVDTTLDLKEEEGDAGSKIGVSQPSSQPESNDLTKDTFRRSLD